MLYFFFSGEFSSSRVSATFNELPVCQMNNVLLKGAPGRMCAFVKSIATAAPQRQCH